MGKPATSVESFWDRPLHELFELLPGNSGRTDDRRGGAAIASVRPKFLRPRISLRYLT